MGRRLLLLLLETILISCLVDVQPQMDTAQVLPRPDGLGGSLIGQVILRVRASTNTG